MLDIDCIIRANAIVKGKDDAIFMATLPTETEQTDYVVRTQA